VCSLDIATCLYLPGNNIFYFLFGSGSFQCRIVHLPQVGAWCSGITSALHAEGLGFKPRRVQLFLLSLASLFSFSTNVGGSNPLKSDADVCLHRDILWKHFVAFGYTSGARGLRSLAVEHSLSKRKVAGSIPVVGFLLYLHQFLVLKFL
jgi:hypothetical protein